jgi:hypothetical protein
VSEENAVETPDLGGVEFDPTIPSSESGTSEVSPETSFDPTETPSSDVYTVKVDGEDHQVTLDELRKGYSREAHFTRQMQQVRARERELREADALASALNRDPRGTLAYLANAYGVELGGGRPAPVRQQAPQADDFDLFGDTPDQGAQQYEVEDPRVSALAAEVARLRADEQTRQTERAMNNLHERFGDFDDNDVYAYAVKWGIPDLERAYRSWRDESAEAAQVAAREAEVQRVRDSKRQAGVVSGGSARQAGTVSEPEPPAGADFKTVALWALKKEGLA